MSAPVVGRFAPTPSGRLHLGNLLCALIAYLSARSQGGRFLLRIEDLDTPRCPKRLCDAAVSDLAWLGVAWDEPPLVQSERTDVYRRYFDALDEKGLLYPCFCSRAQLHAADAPNRGDDMPVYAGTCAHLSPETVAEKLKTRRPAYRLRVPNETIAVCDRHYGLYQENLARDCGDFILRRSDGLFGYQLAVVVDDALSGVNEIVRGHDILSSTPRQRYLQRLLGFETPAYAHIPLLEDAQGRRLAKRDGDTDLSALSKRFTREDILGMLAYSAGILPENRPATMEALIGAIYLDGGIEEAGRFIRDHLLKDVEDKSLFYDAKTILQEMVQSEGNGQLHYKLVRETGPDHNKEFTVETHIGDKAYAVGVGKTKKGAEQVAAYQTILLLKKQQKQ